MFKEPTRQCGTLVEDGRNLWVHMHNHVLILLYLGVSLFDLAVNPLNDAPTSELMTMEM